MIYLKSFTKLSNKEKREILKWRNHRKVRVHMFNDKKISYKEHIKFLKSLKKSKNSHFLVIKDNIPIGVINLKGNEIGLYASPYKKGVGKILLKEAVKYAFWRKNLKNIIVQVFYNNKKAIKLYKKEGFRKIGKTRVNKKQVLIMEKKR